MPLDRKEKYYEKAFREKADPSKFRAVKMDGTKLTTDTTDFVVLRNNKVVGRRAARAEASL